MLILKIDRSIFIHECWLLVSMLAKNRMFQYQHILLRSASLSFIWISWYFLSFKIVGFIFCLDAKSIRKFWWKITFNCVIACVPFVSFVCFHLANDIWITTESRVKENTIVFSWNAFYNGFISRIMAYQFV